jgi:hypothetical protein
VHHGHHQPACLPVHHGPPQRRAVSPS